MTTARAGRMAIVVGMLAVCASAHAGIDADAADLALFRRILRESNAYDAKWLGSYSVRYSSRSTLTHTSGKLDVTAREGFVLVDGRYTSVEDERVESNRPDSVSRMDTATDGQVSVTKSYHMVSGREVAPAHVTIRRDEGRLTQDLSTPMQWLSIANYWRAAHTDTPLERLLTGDAVEEQSALMGDTGTREPLTGRAVRLRTAADTLGGKAMCRVELAVATTFRGKRRETTVTWLLDPAAAYRMARVSLTDGDDTEPFFVDNITLARNTEGVWYPAGVHREPQAYSRQEALVGDISLPAVNGTLESSGAFMEFTTNPEIPEDAFAAIPPEGSAARAEALRAEGPSRRR